MSNTSMSQLPTEEELIILVEEGIKSRALFIIVSYRISGLIGKKNIKCEYAFSEEEKNRLEEANSIDWRRVEKTYAIPTARKIAEEIVKKRYS